MMTPPENGPVRSNHEALSANDQRVVTALEQICVDLDRGQAIDRQEILERYPDVGAELIKCLDGLNIIHDAASPIDATSSSPAQLPSSVSTNVRVLGDFRIIRELGRGGMGVVYEAHQQSLDRRIALKVLPFASLLDKRQLQRFKNEVRAAAMLKHPHIVSVYQTGCERGVHYYAMELVEGRTLREMIDAVRRSNTSSLPTDDSYGGDSDAAGDRTVSGDTSPIAEITTSHSVDRKSYYRFVAQAGVQAARALHYSHELGVVHRDIKPSNLLVDDGANLWISDFGLAQIQGVSDVTLTGDVLGTLRYMSPEQAAGQRQAVDTRTDVYSLGATLYELVTLRPAFGGDDRIQLMRQIEDRDPVPPRAVDEAIPRDLETIIQKAMSKDAAARYGSAAELADDLERFLKHQPILARRTTWRYQLSRLVRRNPYIVTSTAVVLVLLITFSVLVTLAAVSISRLAEQTRDQLYDADMNLVPKLIEDGDFSRAIDILDRHRPDVGQSDLRGMEWFMYRDRCEAATSGQTLRHHRFVYVCQYSPGGDILATAGNPGNIHLWRADTLDHQLTLDPAHGALHALAFRSDHELVSAGEKGTIGFWDVRNRKPSRSALDVSADARQLYSMALSPDGATVAVGYRRKGDLYGSGQPGMVTVWDLHSDRLIARLDELVGHIYALTFSADASQLIVGDESGTLRVWDTSDWARKTTLKAHSEGVFCMTLSADGKMLATGSGIRNSAAIDHGEIKIWDTSTWMPIHRVLHHRQLIRSVDFSRDGTLIAGSYDGQVSLWSSARGRRQLSFGAHTAEVLSLCFTPDGQQVCSASMDCTARVWDVPKLFNALRDADTYRGHDAMILGVAFFDRARKACTIDFRGQLHIWDTSTGETLARRDLESGNGDLDVARDDRTMAIVSGKREGPAVLRLFDLGDVASIRRDPTWQYELPDGFWHGIEISPNGDQVALASQTELQVRSAKTGEPITTFGPLDGRTIGIRYSRDGHTIACTTVAGSTYVFRANDLQLVHRFDSDRGATYCAEFSPDGRTLITGGEDNVIKKWDAESFEPLGQFAPCTNAVACLRYSTDGMRVVSSTADGTVQIWRPQTGRPVFEARDRNAHLCVNLAMSQDGLVFASGVDVMRVWRVPKPDTVFQDLRVNEVVVGQ